MADLLSEFESYGSGQSGRVRDPQRVLGGPSALNPFEEDQSSIVDERALRGSGLEQPIERKAQDFPILKRQDITKFRIPGHITHIAVSNNLVSVAVLGNSIYRYDLKGSNPVEVCDIKREDDARIHKIFQDPKAHHLLVFMESKEAYYVSRGGPKKPQPRLLQRFKGFFVESVAWNKTELSDQSTGPILLGTSSGVICEAFVDTQKKSYCNEIYRLMDDMAGQPEMVTGLHMEPFPRFGTTYTENKWYVLVTTPCRVYQFIGFCNPKAETQFLDFFSYYSDSMKTQFQEIPGSLKDSKLCVWPPYSPRDPPTSFAWLTGAGVYYSTLVFGDQGPGESIFVEKNLIPYSAVNETADDGKVEWNQKDAVLPIGLSLTKFHCVLLYRDKTVAICHLNNKKVFEDVFAVRRHGPLFAMCTDPVTGSIWTHAKLNLMMFTTYKESRNVWKIYLDQEDFTLAQKYAEGNQKDLDTILVRQADSYFKKGRYENAAIVFSKSRLSFEQVTLKFMQVNKKDALKVFLLRKLDSLTEQDSTQQTMLSTWLTELYLNELGNLMDEGNMSGYLELQEEFHKFLEKPSLKECFEVNSKTMYDLMSSHGATDDVIYFAKQMNDYDRVITHYIQQYKYEEALEMLSSQAKKVLDNSEKSERRLRFQKFASLYYKFSPIFVKHIPKQAVESWIAADRYLDPKRLIPALIQCNQPGEPLQEEQNDAAIKYLEFCVETLKSEVTSVHNFLISSFANSNDPNDHMKLQKYLIKQAYGGLTPNYDPQYALRLCLDKSLDGACVYIYSAMGLYEESVSLALRTKDVELAQQMIESNAMVRKDVQLQKKLWLKIAEHVITKEKNITKAMKFLNDCHVLKIEDVLPFFSDVVTIDQFKDAICDSLQSYNSHIDQLKKEMEGATESAKNIRSDIQEIRNKSVVIKSDQKCNVCKGRLLSQPFYMYPCHHSFHRDCLVNEVSVIFSAQEIEQIKLLIRSLDNDKDGKERDEMKLKLDQMIASDCPHCGLTMIRSISVPLLPLNIMDKILASWK